MYRGRVVGTVGPEASRHVLGLMMAGVPYDEALAQARAEDAAHDATHDAPVVDGGAL
jgi:simple sugar transport system ATP-binding protein